MPIPGGACRNIGDDDEHIAGLRRIATLYRGGGRIGVVPACT